MAGRAKWRERAVPGGVEIKLRTWSHYFDYVRNRALHFPNYIWRGQRDAKWKLESCFDRETRMNSSSDKEAIAADHLATFTKAIRGRRGPFPTKLKTDDEIWALGAHNGLATPLLDWTSSPFVALYFSFIEEGTPRTRERAVWGLASDDDFIGRMRDKLKLQSNQMLRYIRPLQDENPRLVSQAGLFTRAPWGHTVESWVRKYFATSDRIALIKISITNHGREDCLRTLNRMNINHLSLFPDIFGASAHCNHDLRIAHY